MKGRDVGLLLRVWGEWQVKLQEIAKRKSARVEIPHLAGPRDLGDGTFSFDLDQPIVIARAPQKSASSKGPRHAIFVHGAFLFDNSGESPDLVNASASVTFYNVRPPKVFGQPLQAELLDAIHFDMEDASSQKAYHPIFHAQRGADARLDEREVRAALATAYNISDEGLVEIKQLPVPGTPYLRLPTPQLDLFAVLTMLMADFFFHLPGGRGEARREDPKAFVQFRALLDLLKDSRNIARQGVSSSILSGRHDAEGFISPAHWYVESQGPAF